MSAALGASAFRKRSSRMVALFGERGTIEITMVMGDYAMTAMLLNAVNQQLPPDWEPLLPMP